MDRDQAGQPVQVFTVCLPPVASHDIPTYLVKQLVPVGQERDDTVMMQLRKRTAFDTHLQSCCLDTKFLQAALG